MCLDSAVLGRASRALPGVLSPTIIVLGMTLDRGSGSESAPSSGTGFESCIYCLHDGPPHSTVMAQSTPHQRRCEGCAKCEAEIAAEGPRSPSEHHSLHDEMHHFLHGLHEAIDPPDR